MSPWVGRAVAGVCGALQACFIAVIDARYARIGHLHEGGKPESTLGKTKLVVWQAPCCPLVFGNAIRIVHPA